MLSRSFFHSICHSYSNNMATIGILPLDPNHTEKKDLKKLTRGLHKYPVVLQVELLKPGMLHRPEK